MGDRCRMTAARFEAQAQFYHGHFHAISAGVVVHRHPAALADAACRHCRQELPPVMPGAAVRERDEQSRPERSYLSNW